MQRFVGGKPESPIAEVCKAKDIATRAVFGKPTSGFSGSSNDNFIMLLGGNEEIYICSENATHSSVTIYYGIKPLVARMQMGTRMNWDSFCIFLKNQSCR